MKCQLCGSEEDVVKTYEHVGGQGDVEPVIQCRLIKECWSSYDEANGIKKLESSPSFIEAK